ncbi:MAG: hypothetical protein V3T22_11220 [Planctomycetota bacterium]
MAWDIMTPSVISDANGLKPVLTTKRDVIGGASDPDLATARKPTSWSDFGDLAADGAAWQHAFFSVSYHTPSGTPIRLANWLVSQLEGSPHSGVMHDFIHAVLTVNVFVGADYQPLSNLEADYIYTFFFGASDLAEKTGESTPHFYQEWGAASIGPAGEADFSDSVVQVKTFPGIPTLPALCARWVGATKAEFKFAINVNTFVSTCAVTLRWREGRHTDTSTWDGQVEVAGTAKGSTVETYTANITGLTAGKEYTVWVYLNRDTQGLKTYDSAVSYLTAEDSDDYTIGDDANVSLTLTPTSANFNFSFGISRLQRAARLFNPRTWVEVAKTSDIVSGVWPAEALIHRSPYIGPFYPDEDAIVIGGQLVCNALVGGEGKGASLVKDVVSAITDVERLTQATAYTYRIALENPSGTVYPFEGTFKTPNFDGTRQTIASHFTLGSF